jgi:hypothetical protein
VPGGVFIVQGHGRGFEGDMAMSLDRVAGIEHQIHQHLLQLASIGPHRAKPGRHPDFEGDVGAEQPGQHVTGALDNRIDIEQGWRQDLAAREGKELAYDLGGPATRLQDFLDVPGLGMVRS